MLGDHRENFLAQDLALAQEANLLYSQGLQMGQAVRNIVMDPTNQLAYKNLDAASAEFKKASQKALALAATHPDDLKVLQEVVALREQQIPLHAKVVSLASSDQAAAIAVISKEETPVWREIRTRLMDYLKVKRGAVENTKTEMAAFSQRMLTITLVLVALALVVASAIVFWLVRHIMKQLGGEPAYAVEIAGDPVAQAEIEDIRWLDPLRERDVTVAPLSREHILPAWLAQRKRATP